MRRSTAASFAVLAATAMSGAHARAIDCNEPSPIKCLVNTERTQPAREPFSPRGSLSSAAARPVAAAEVALWVPGVAGTSSRSPDTAGTARDTLSLSSDAATTNNEPPVLGLLLASLGIVVFIAHRRNGG